MLSYLRDHHDRRDERRAHVWREQLGRHGRLVSWTRLDHSRWLARLSCEELTETLEEVGRTRCEAIERAEHVLRIDLAHRGRRGG